MKLPWRKPSVRRAHGAHDRRPRHEHHRERDLLARQSDALPGGVGPRKIRSGGEPYILAEYEEVVARLSRRYPARQAVDWLVAIKQAAHLYFPAPRPAATADPDDEMLIECAVTAHADYLVTGDKGHLLVLKQADGIPIISAADFLHRLGGDSGRAG